MPQGSCNCGAVRFTVSQDLPPPNACHCTACRKQSGHFGVSCDVPRAALTIEGEAAITWFQMSEKVRRGFCSTCGSNLFWDPTFQDWTAISMGSIDGDSGTAMNLHIFVAEKGDYYQIADGLPQNER